MPCPFTGPFHSISIQKNWFCARTKVFEKALNPVKFLDWLKNFGPAQNILGPLKGRGINVKQLHATYLLQMFHFGSEFQLQK